MSTHLEVGNTVKTGQYLLLTSGEYSDYIVNGLYRAKCEFTVPGIQLTYGPNKLTPDIHAISINVEWVEELDYAEAHQDEY